MASKTPQHEDAHRALFSAQWFAELSESLATMVRVIHAIIIREARTRYGSSPIGYTWALIDPIIELTVLLVAFSAIGRTSPIAAPLPVFLIMGIMPFYLVRGAIGRGASAISANLGLISYPQVMPADVVLGRVVLEAATTVVVFMLFIFALTFAIDIPLSSVFADPTGMLLAFGATFYFCVGVGFLSSSLARVLPIWQNIWGYMSRPIWLLSGVFFTLSQLPSTARQYMIYNPIAHILEWTRSAAIDSFESDVYDPAFILIVATVCLLIGLIIDRMLLMTGDEEIVS